MTNDLISREKLYEQTAEWEAAALDHVGKLDPRNGPEEREEWVRWSAILQERTAFKCDVQDAPAAEPERKTGKWIKAGRWGRVYKCNQCGNLLDFDGVNVGRGSTNFCPNCGAKMEAEQ